MPGLRASSDALATPTGPYHWLKGTQSLPQKELFLTVCVCMLAREKIKKEGATERKCVCDLKAQSYCRRPEEGLALRASQLGSSTRWALLGAVTRLHRELCLHCCSERPYMALGFPWKKARIEAEGEKVQGDCNYTFQLMLCSQNNRPAWEPSLFPWAVTVSGPWREGAWGDNEVRRPQ